MDNEINELVNNMPVCDICEEPFRMGDKKTEAPCCGKETHTQCMITLIANAISRWNDVICYCGHTLHYVNNNDYHVNRQGENAAVRATLEERKKNPVYNADYKRLKRAMSALNTATIAFKKSIKERKIQLMETINTSIDIIKTAKQEVVDTIKGSDEFKTLRSAQARQTSLYNRFMQTHQLNTADMQGVFSKTGRRRRRYQRSGVAQIGSELRIRL